MRLNTFAEIIPSVIGPPIGAFGEWNARMDHALIKKIIAQVRCLGHKYRAARLSAPSSRPAARRRARAARLTSKACPSEPAGLPTSTRLGRLALQAAKPGSSHSENLARALWLSAVASRTAA